MSHPVRARLVEDWYDDLMNPFRDDVDNDCEDWEKDFDGECPDYETESDELTAEADGEHPRHPAGRPDGGQFAPKGGDTEKKPVPPGKHYSDEDYERRSPQQRQQEWSDVFAGKSGPPTGGKKLPAGSDPFGVHYGKTTEDKDEHGYGSYPKGRGVNKARDWGSATAKASIPTARDLGYTGQDPYGSSDAKVDLRHEDGSSLEIYPGGNWIWYGPPEMPARGPQVRLDPRPFRGEGPEQLRQWLSGVHGPQKKAEEVAPPGWSGTVKAMKSHKDIANPFALAWAMHNRGDSPHVKPEKKAEGEFTEDKDEHGYGSYPRGERGRSEMGTMSGGGTGGAGRPSDDEARTRLGMKQPGLLARLLGPWTEPEPERRRGAGRWGRGTGETPGRAVLDYEKWSPRAREAQAIVVAQARFVEAMPASGGMALLRTGVTTVPDVPMASFHDDLQRKVSLRRVMRPHDDEQAGNDAVQGESRLAQTDPRVNYRYASNKSRSCGACENFQPPGGCSKVTGMIRRTDYCDLFSPSETPRMAQAVFEDVSDQNASGDE